MKNKAIIKDLAVPIGTAITFFIIGYYYSKHEIATKVLANIKPCYDIEEIILIIN